jgi:hypothetical protein
MTAILLYIYIPRVEGWRRGRDRMVVVFTTYAISAFHH